MKTGTKQTVGFGAAALMSLFAGTATAGAQQYDDTGWWVAEELVAGQTEFKEAPQPRVIAVGAYDSRDDKKGRKRDRDRNRYDERDEYGERDRYDERDRYNDDDRYRGRQGGIVIPGGRVTLRRRPYARNRRARGAYGYSRPIWRRVHWDVRLRGDRFRDHRRRARLRDVVGRRTFRRLQEHRNWIGARGRLTYRWVSMGYRGDILQVRAGQVPIAEFVDFGHDGRVDIVRLVR